MNNSLIQTPKNTTKRAGTGCSIIGFSFRESVRFSTAERLIKCFRVKTFNKEEAMRVISHYKQVLQNSGNNNAK